jgi:hypothetical protein
MGVIEFISIPAISLFKNLIYYNHKNMNENNTTGGLPPEVSIRTMTVGEALMLLNKRIKERLARGVECKHLM